MEVLLNDDYQKIDFCNEDKIMFFLIKKDSQKLSEKEYIDKVVVDGANLIKQVKPKKIFLDVRSFRYVLSVEGEKRLQDIILEAYRVAGVKKLAVLIPDDVLAQITIAQVTDVQEDFITKYFVNEKKAYDWLKK